MLHDFNYWRPQTSFSLLVWSAISVHTSDWTFMMNRFCIFKWFIYSWVTWNKKTPLIGLWQREHRDLCIIFIITCTFESTESRIQVTCWIFQAFLSLRVFSAQKTWKTYTLLLFFVLSVDTEKSLSGRVSLGRQCLRASAGYRLRFRLEALCSIISLSALKPLTHKTLGQNSLSKKEEKKNTTEEVSLRMW